MDVVLDKAGAVLEYSVYCMALCLMLFPTFLNKKMGGGVFWSKISLISFLFAFSVGGGGAFLMKS